MGLQLLPRLTRTMLPKLALLMSVSTGAWLTAGAAAAAAAEAEEADWLGLDVLPLPSATQLPPWLHVTCNKPIIPVKRPSISQSQ